MTYFRRVESGKVGIRNTIGHSICGRWCGVWVPSGQWGGGMNIVCVRRGGSMNRLDFTMCWFSLYLIAEKSIKIFFYEIKLGKKVELNYHIAQG